MRFEHEFFFFFKLCEEKPYLKKKKEKKTSRLHSTIEQQNIGSIKEVTLFAKRTFRCEGKKKAFSVISPLYHFVPLFGPNPMSAGQQVKLNEEKYSDKMNVNRHVSDINKNLIFLNVYKCHRKGLLERILSPIKYVFVYDIFLTISHVHIGHEILLMFQTQIRIQNVVVHYIPKLQRCSKITDIHVVSTFVLIYKLWTIRTNREHFYGH